MDQFRNEEVFIVTGNEEEETSELFITNDRMDLNEHLILKNPAVDEDVRLFHGVLTTAEFLPADFKGRSVFIVCLAPDKMDQGCVVEGGATPSEVAKEIEAIILSASPFTFGDLDIDSIYILYGYQLELGLAVNDDEIDEEYIYACQDIADKTIEVEDEIVEKGA
jgi:hypothetical protein